MLLKTLCQQRFEGFSLLGSRIRELLSWQQQQVEVRSNARVVQVISGLTYLRVKWQRTVQHSTVQKGPTVTCDSDICDCDRSCSSRIDKICDYSCRRQSQSHKMYPRPLFVFTELRFQLCKFCRAAKAWPRAAAG